MATKRIWLGAATLQDKVFAVGGYDGQSYLNVVEMFDPGRATPRGEWKRVASLQQASADDTFTLLLPSTTTTTND